MTLMYLKILTSLPIVPEIRLKSFIGKLEHGLLVSNV